MIGAIFKKIFISILYCLFPTVFNIVFFIAIERDNNIFEWLSYAFVHAAYLSIIIVTIVRCHKPKRLMCYSYNSVDRICCILAILCVGLALIVATISFNIGLIVWAAMGIGAVGALIAVTIYYLHLSQPGCYGRTWPQYKNNNKRRTK